MPLPREQFLDQLQQRERRYVELELALLAQANQPDSKDYQALSRELAQLRETVALFRTCQRIEREVHEAEQLVHAQADAELRELAREEVISLRQQQADLWAQLERWWEEEHQTPERPIIVEIRAATGGLESSLFVGDVYRMYAKYAAKSHLKVELMESQPTEAGGFKEIVCSVKGPGAWQQFQYESGVHRVQRVPATEAQGRIHTSTITVAVLPEAEEVDIQIRSEDLKIEVYRSGGAGGQSVNTTDSAVRITHLPTGTVVAMQDERSQLKNKERAMKVLRSRIYEAERARKEAEYAANRRSMVGTGDRSERIRTYNFPQSRMTDHRIGFTSHALTEIMNGALDDVMDALITQQQAEQLKNANDIL